MKRQNRRFYLKVCRTCAIAAAGALSLSGGANADEPRILTTVVQPTGHRQVATVSPEWAVETLSSSSSYATAVRMQAVGVLEATVWQGDAASEDALIRALRSDPCDSVRVRVAAVFARTKILTPKAYNALQISFVGSTRDGFPGERCAAVKAHAARALQTHPTSASPHEIAALQEQTANGRAALTMPGSFPKRDGSEEASPPDVVPAARTSRASPTNAPCDCAATAIGPIATVPEQKSFWRWLPFGKRTTPSTTVVPVVISAPVTQAMPTAKLPTVNSVQTVSTPAALPPETRIPIASDHAAVFEKEAPQPLVVTPQDNNVSLKERRSELRQMGLQDPTLKMFTSDTGAGPPIPPAAQPSETSNVLRRLFKDSTRP